MRPPELAFLRTPGVPALSPDGSLAVVAVTRIDLPADEYRSDLWLVPTDGSGPARQITYGPRDTAPRWSPDGRWLAFLRAGRDDPAQLVLLPTDLGEPRAITTREQHPLGVETPVWSPDSRLLAYVARVPEAGRYGGPDGVPAAREAPRRLTRLRYREDGIGFLLDRPPHVFVLDPFVDAPGPVRVTDRDGDHADVAWSPDGHTVVFSSDIDTPDGASLYRDVYACVFPGGDVRRVTRGDVRRVTGGSHSAWRPVVTPDGTAVVFLADSDLGPDGSDFVGRNTTLWSVPLDGSTEPVPLTDPERLDLLEITGGPALDGDGVLLGVQVRGAVELLRVPLAGGDPVRLLTGHRQVLGAAGSDAGVIVATVCDDRTCGELVALRDGTERVLTGFGRQLADHVPPRPMEEITACAPDGYPVHGWVVRPDPAAFPGPRPVLLLIHGGPYRQYGWALFDEVQVYAGAGYAVVFGNPRGSSGYGQAHGRAIRHAMGTLDADDVLALLDAALAAPDLDADRVGVMGGSYGGFLTNWLAGHAPGRFRAAISERALNAWDSFTGSSDIGYFFAAAYTGTDPVQVAAQSPLSYADKIDIPVLIIHSEQDWRCPLEQAQRMYVGLRQRGVPAEMLLFPGEGHELSRSGLPSHRLARFDAILDWWERHLQGG